MLKNIMDGISVKLDSVYNEISNTYAIYGDTDVIQNLAEPCFFIAVLQPSQKPYIMGRYFRSYPFDVHFFPAEDYDNAAMQEMADGLFAVLEYIVLPNGDLVRGTEMSYNIADGVLHFFVSYNVFLRSTEEIGNMETLDIITGVGDIPKPKPRPEPEEPEEPEEPGEPEPDEPNGTEPMGDLTIENGTEEQNDGN